MERNEASFDISKRKLFIALPAYDHKVSIKMAVALAQFAAMAPAHGLQIQVANISGCSVVSRVRNLLANEFLETDFTDLLFIDSDINFDPNDIFRLLAFASGQRDIVAGIATARKKEKVYFSMLDVDENKNIIMDKMGLVRALRAGTGFMMIRRHVFETLKEAHPEWAYHDHNTGKTLHSFFDFKSTPEGYLGEDFLFCDRARQHGYQVWVDPTIKLGHMGVEEFHGSFGEEFLYPLLKPIEQGKEAA